MIKRETMESAGKESPEQKQTGPRIMVKLDESGMSTNYANAFRTYQTLEELVLDFGLNMVAAMPADADGADGAMKLTMNDRIIMNFQMAKRLAISLTSVVRAHEQKYGEIKLQIPA